MVKHNSWAIRADQRNEYIIVYKKQKRKANEYQVICFAIDILGADVWEIKGAIKAIKSSPDCGIFKVFREDPVWYSWTHWRTKEEIHEEFMKEYQPYFQNPTPSRTVSVWRNAVTGEEISSEEFHKRYDEGIIKEKMIGTIDDCYKNLI